MTATLDGLTQRPQAAAALREVGDSRAARRRTAAVAIVVAGLVAAALGLVQVLPGGDGGGPGPGPDNELQVNPTPRVERPGEVAEDFDLAAGLSQDGRTGPAFDLDPFPGWEVCGRSYELGGLTTPGLGVRSDDFGMETGRLLVVARGASTSPTRTSTRTGSPSATSSGSPVARRRPRCRRAWSGPWSATRRGAMVCGRGRPTPAPGRSSRSSGSAPPSSCPAPATSRGDAIALDSFRRAEAYAIAPVVQRMCVWNDHRVLLLRDAHGDATDRRAQAYPSRGHRDEKGVTG